MRDLGVRRFVRELEVLLRRPAGSWGSKCSSTSPCGTSCASNLLVEANGRRIGYIRYIPDAFPGNSVLGLVHYNSLWPLTAREAELTRVVASRELSRVVIAQGWGDKGADHLEQFLLLLELLSTGKVHYSSEPGASTLLNS